MLSAELIHAHTLCNNIISVFYADDHLPTVYLYLTLVMVVNLIHGNFNDYKMAAMALREWRTSYSSGKKAFERNLQVKNVLS